MSTRTHSGWRQADAQTAFPRVSMLLVCGFVLSLVFLFHARALEVWTSLPSVSLPGYGLMVFVTFLGLLLSPVRFVLRIEDRVLVAFAILVFLRASLSIQPIVALREASILVGAGLLQYFCARITLWTLGRMEFIVCSSIALVSAITVFLALSLADSGMYRVTVGAGTNPVGFSLPIVSSGAAALAVAYCAVVASLGGRRAKRFLFATVALLVFLLSARLALATGTRSTLVAFVTVAFGFLLLRLLSASAQTFVVFMVLALGAMLLGAAYGASASIWLADVLGGSLGERWGNAFTRLAQAFDENSVSMSVRDLSVDERMFSLATHWDAFSAYVWFGAGPRVVDAGGPLLYPHNLFVELLAYYGFFGLLLFATFLLIVAVRVVDIAKWSALGFTACIAVALCLGAIAQLQFSFTLWMAKPLFFGMAIIVTLHQKHAAATLPQDHAATTRARQRGAFRARTDLYPVAPRGVPNKQKIPLLARQNAMQ